MDGSDFPVPVQYIVYLFVFRLHAKCPSGLFYNLRGSLLTPSTVCVPWVLTGIKYRLIGDSLKRKLRFVL